MTTQTEPVRTKIKTSHVDPLYYGIAKGRVIFPPSSFAMADIYLRPDSELTIAIPQWQEYARNLYESRDTTDPKYLRGIQASPPALETAIKRGIRREKDSTKLWDEDATTAIKNGHLENRRLTAKVASRRATGPEVLEYVDVIIDSPHFNPTTAVDYRFVNCRSDEFHWGLSKGTNLLCPHEAMAIIQYFQEYPGKPNGKIRIVSPKGRPYVPYKLPLVEEIDVLVRRYGLKQTFYEINKRLLSNPLNLDNALLAVLQNTDSLTFEVVPQRFRPKIVEEKSEQEAEVVVTQQLIEDTLQRFRVAGYIHRGNMAIEFKDTENEVLSSHFETPDGRNALRLFYDEGFGVPMVLGLELLDEKKLFPELHKGGLGLYDRFEYVDDRTRRVARAVLMTPSMFVDPFLVQPIPIQHVLVRKYREVVAQLNPGNKDQLIGQLRLVA